MLPLASGISPIAVPPSFGPARPAHHRAVGDGADRRHGFLDPVEQAAIDRHRQCPLVSFNPAMQATTPRISSSRGRLAGSPNHTMPAITVPSAPMPPHTA